MSISVLTWHTAAALSACKIRSAWSGSSSSVANPPAAATASSRRSSTAARQPRRNRRSRGCAWLAILGMLAVWPFVILYELLVFLLMTCCCSRKWSAFTASLLCLLIAATILISIPSLIGRQGWAGAAVSRLPDLVVSIQFTDTVLGHVYAVTVLLTHVFRSVCRLTTFALIGLANLPWLAVSVRVLVIVSAQM